jgi:hypothetical protein
MLWYLQGVNSGELNIDWFVQYADGFGRKPDGDKISNDETLLPYNLVEVYNDTIRKLTNDPFYINNLIIDETKTQNYNPANSIKNYKPATSSNSGSGSGSGSVSKIIPLALIALAAKFLIFK